MKDNEKDDDLVRAKPEIVSDRVRPAERVAADSEGVSEEVTVSDREKVPVCDLWLRDTVLSRVTVVVTESCEREIVSDSVIRESCCDAV